MRHAAIWSGPSVGIPSSSSNNTFGSWTSYGTTPFALSGFYISIAGANSSSYIVAVNLGIGSSGSVILFPYLYFNVIFARTFVPMYIPPGTALYAQSAGGNTASVTPTLQIVGVGAGGVSRESKISVVGSLGFSTSNTYIVIGYSNGTTQITSSPINMPIKKLITTFGASNGTFSIGIGPSSSVVATILGDIFLPVKPNNENIMQEFDVDIPAGMNIFFTNNSSSDFYGGIYYMC